MPVGEESSGQAGAEGFQSPSASTGQAAAMAVVSGGQEGNIYRDRDPPPSYDGESPELTFRAFQKSVQLWEFETDIPAKKRGVKLLRALKGVAQLAVEDMEVDDITSELGVKNIMEKLKDYFHPHLEVSLPRAFETAVYGTPRQSKESFAQYVKRMERSFAHLAKEGVDLPDSARKYILFRQASLTEPQEQRLLTWAEGKYTRAEITSALRRLDKVIKDKGKSAYVGEASEVEAFHYEGAIESDEDESYVYLVDGDLDTIMDEGEVQEALASYREVRQSLKEQRLRRGYFPGKGKGKFDPFGKGRGKSKVHIEQLNLRTRCRRCQQVGHWERECRNPPASDRGRTNVSSSASTSSSKGFFVQLAQPSEASTEGPSNFWLRQFLAHQKASREADADSCAPSGAYKERIVSSDQQSFCGISTKPFEGVVDTAAEGGLIGLEPLWRLQSALAKHGLKIKWIPKRSTAKGVGGNATVEGVALIPLGLGGVNGILETTVIQGDVPLLLPTSACIGRHVGFAEASNDFAKASSCFRPT